MSVKDFFEDEDWLVEDEADHDDFEDEFDIIPRAINGITLESLFRERKKYDNIHSELEWPTTVKAIDFQIKRNLYGKVNSNREPIFLKTENLVSIENTATEESFSVLPPIALAFQSFQREMKVLSFQGIIDDPESKLYNINPTKGWVSAYELYKDHMELYYNEVLKDFMETNHTKIRNFEDFINMLVSLYVDSKIEFPFTFGGFIKSYFCPIETSGLVIHIDDELDISSDEEKYVRYIDDINFPNYVNIAMKHGFRIDRDIPWRLVADLKSAAMQQYILDTMEVPDLNGFLATAYQKASGFELLREYFFDIYNRFVTIRPISNVTKMKCNKTVSRVMIRKKMSRSELMQKYDFFYWAEKYVKIRLTEMNEYAIVAEKDIMNYVQKIKKLDIYSLLSAVGETNIDVHSKMMELVENKLKCYEYGMHSKRKKFTVSKTESRLEAPSYTPPSSGMTGRGGSGGSSY